jgi:STE24 endopeptidase
VISNQLSRRVEARADTFALRLTDAPEPFVSFEKRISVRNVSDPDPPDWVTWTMGTHPPTLERIGAAVAFERGAG